MKKLITTLAVTLVAATVVQADTIAGWEFSADLANQVNPPVPTTHADISVNNNLSVSAGFAGSVAVDWPNTWGVKNTGSNGIYDGSLEGAILSGRYISVSLTPDAGTQINFDDVVYDATGGGTASIVGVGLLSSLTGYAVGDVLGTNSVATGWPMVTEDLSFDVSGVSGLQGVDQEVEFRFYLWAESGSPSRLGFGKAFAGEPTDDLVFNGTVVPEPSTLALVGLASAGMFIFRKRFRS